MPSINGISDRDAQMLTINIAHKQIHKKYYYYMRKINNHTISDFHLKLSYEMWDMIFGGEDVNSLFNDTHDTLTQAFHLRKLIIKCTKTLG